MPVAPLALPNIIWIGGSPCAGKSSIADALALTYGFSVYRCDDAFTRHAEQVVPGRQPVWARLNSLSCDGLWMRPVERQITDEIAFYREEFPMILDDLAGIPAGQTVIAEGAALLPELLDEFIASPRRAIWIVPTPEFQLTHYARRDWTASTLAGCTDRDAAWRNWMERDIRFARYVAQTAATLQYPLLTVDGSHSLEENIATARMRLEV